MNHRLGCTVLAYLLFVAGCTPFGNRENRPQNVYLLEGAGAIQPLQQRPGCHVLMINALRAAPGFATSGFAWRRNDPRIRYFAYHRWTDSPARMLQPQLIRAAERSNLFQGVVTPASPASSSLRLDGELLDLSQYFQNGESHVRLALRVRLFAEGRLLASQVFEPTEPTEPNPESGIQAANRASAKMLGQVMQFVHDTLQRSAPVCTSTAKP
jgi:ABC-type uncharacterized transport system auxiliary subunit